MHSLSEVDLTLRRGRDEGRRRNIEMTMNEGILDDDEHNLGVCRRGEGV